MPEVLAGRAILVVEDEYFLASDLERELLRVGANVVGPVPSIETAMILIESTPRIDGAILDMSLRGEMAHPVADALLNRSVPLLLTTGYDTASLPERLLTVLRLEKPIEAKAVVRGMGRLIAAGPGADTSKV